MSLKMPAYEALDRLESRIRRERPLAAVIGDWSSGYVGVLNGREFTFRKARNIPHRYALKAYGSVNDHEGGGSVVTVRFMRGRWATESIWLGRFLIAVLVIVELVAVSGQPDLLAVVFLGLVIVGARLWLYRERESDRRALREFLLETFPDSSVMGSIR
jgi:membrane protein DedA with SNARE-associated domain